MSLSIAKMLFLPALVAGTQVVAAPASISTFGLSCTELGGYSYGAVTIAVAENIPAGSYTDPDGTTHADLPAFCRIAGSSQPAPDSEIGFEVWVPLADWNGKYLQVGTIAYAGRIEYGALSFALRRGYATATTDGGHRASPADASWALDAPEQIVDWGYRAVGETISIGKGVVTALTGCWPQRAYFFGGSNGGRDALIVAQRYPAAFDGVIADSPVGDWSRTAFSWLWTPRALLEAPASTITSAKLPAIQASALAQCDAVDGILDEIIADPRLCEFDASRLSCVGAETDNCLTPAQVDALMKVVSGPTDSAGGRIFSGFEPYAAAVPGTWDQWITGPGHLILANEFFANMVFDTGDENFDFTLVDFDSDVSLTRNKPVLDNTLSGVIDAVDPDLRAFRSSGGKLILYVGWEDAVIPPRGLIDYYESVVARNVKGTPQALKQVRKFFRLFLVPGMGHFTGGPGAHGFGALYGLPGLSIDPRYDVLSALEAWVEQGIAPGQIVGAKYVNDNPAQGVVRTRPICAYPQVAQWTGQGNTDEAENFICVDGARGAYLR